MKIAVITTSRADWNGLGMVAKELVREGAEVTILAEADEVTRYRDAITADGFPWGTLAIWVWSTRNDYRTLARGTLFDAAVLLGDRHETLHAALGCVYGGLPVVHIAGGDKTIGSLDDLYRNAITKLAMLHFPTSIRSAKRIIGMGETPGSVHTFGSPIASRIASTVTIPAGLLWEQLGIPYDMLRTDGAILANWQVETAFERNKGLGVMLEALADIESPIIFVGVNPEPDANEAQAMIESFARERRRVRLFENLSAQEYFSVLAHCRFMIGNSSSAYYEAPYFGTPAVDIGLRQAGRPGASNIVRTTAELGAVKASIEVAMAMGRVVSSVWGGPDVAAMIAKVIVSNVPWIVPGIKGMTKADFHG